MNKGSLKSQFKVSPMVCVAYLFPYASLFGDVNHEGYLA